MKKIFLAILLAQTVWLGFAQQINQPPLVPQKYLELPVGAIKPAGWLKEQLTIMLNHSTGHLDEYFWAVNADCGWLGGKGNAGESAPYWLDGAVPLAYMLNNQILKTKVQKYIDWTLNNQRPSGYFGPITKYERETGKQVEKGDQGDGWWTKTLMLKPLAQYYSATGDKRVIPFMTKYFRYQYKNLNDFPFPSDLTHPDAWAQARGEENMMMVYWLYNITKDKFLLDLGNMINKQAIPWTDLFLNRDWVMNAAARQNDKDWMSRHGVNVAMAIKDPVIRYQATGDPKCLEALKTGWNDLMLLHGLPMGVFSGDEDLSGNSPTQGVELCAVVETMFSLEQAMSITGDNRYMDALERATFNALPAQTTDDYVHKQYFQTANQVQVCKDVYDFTLPWEGMHNVFGAPVSCMCCLCNMHQGWTKFTTHLWYATPDNGLAALAYSPSNVTAQVANGIPVTISEETLYPFSGTVNLTVSLPKSTGFPLELRIPVWCAEASISLNGQKLQTGKGGTMARIAREWRNGDKITLEFPMQVTTGNWGKNSRAIERGPLVYALKIGTRWEAKTEKGNDSGPYYELFATTPWNYGIEKAVVENPVANSKVIEKQVEGNFFWNPEKAPIEIQVSGRKIPGWVLSNSAPTQPVTDRFGTYADKTEGKVDEKVETLTLIPYGCSKLRIVAFPVVK